MFEKNTREINRRMVITFAVSSLLLLILLLLNDALFHFNPMTVKIIVFLGIPLTLSPALLYSLKFPDNFVKYYMAISISILIGILGCFNDIGIYITFTLIPIASCMYFDAKYTLFCSIFSYFVMFFSVYINSAGKLEVTELGYTRLSVFWGYIAGFTFEYIVIALCIFEIMKKAKEVLSDERKALNELKAKDARYELLMKGTTDVFFEYHLDTNTYIANRSLFQSKSSSNKFIESDDVDNLVADYPQFKTLVDKLKVACQNQNFEEFELDMSYTKDGKPVPLWFVCEFFVETKDNKPVTIVGKLHDITNIKELQQKIHKEQFSNIYSESKRGQNSLYKQVLEASVNFSEAEYSILLAGHQFISVLFDQIKYEDDAVSSINNVLLEIGRYFHLDRVAVLEMDMISGTSNVSYQWNSKRSDYLINQFTHIDAENAMLTTSIYDENGYIEYNPTLEKVTNTGLSEYTSSDRTVLDINLGTQLWIPTISGDEYSGAVYFDKYDTTPYTIVEKFLLAEVVNSINTLVQKINADNANRAKSDFLSAMSHEIRTPLNAIVGMTEVALREDASAEVKKNLNMVKSSAFGLLTIINDILDFSKIEAGRFEIIPENFSLLSILNDVKEIANTRNSGKIDFTMNVPADLPRVIFADAVRIKQVMINFCTNAIKYTDKGSVTVDIDLIKTDTDKADLSFVIRDTGIGIKEEDLAKLFKSYTQVDTTLNHHKEGTGLGLAICKQLVELMNGSVNVKSKYNEGSQFSFVIPVDVIDWTAAGELENYNYEHESEETDETKPFTAPDARILIVDDSEVNLMVAKALMAPTQMQIDTASSGKLALVKLIENKYDLIFMDHFMPELDGVETTHCIRALDGNPNQKIPIIALTADAISGVKEELISSGMDDFISKPILMDNLIQVLKKWLPQK